MQTVACPNCGAEVVFRSPALPVSVCTYCRTEVMRVGEELRNMGKAAVLPFDVSPIRIGTRGRFEGQNFEIIGRVRWGWSDGSWNEWLMLFADMTHGWLGEAMGQFMVTRQVALESARGLEGNLTIGSLIAVGGVDYALADVREAKCLAAEGELPFVAPPGWTITSGDFRNPQGGLASFQQDGEEATLYTGRYIELAELEPKDLREITGWSRPSFAA